MKLTRRSALIGALTMPAVIRSLSGARAATTLKISHQFPGGSIEQGDFRDRLVRTFAQEVEKRTNGELKFEIYPGSSLMKTKAQFSALRKAALDMSLYPLAYAGGEIHALNIGLMPHFLQGFADQFDCRGKHLFRGISHVSDPEGFPGQRS